MEGDKRHHLESIIVCEICEMTGGGGGGGEVYKQLNDLITSYGSSTVIAAYGQNYPGKLSNFYPAEVFRLAVGGRKFAKLRR